jgi:hypothetical protein
MGRLSHTICGHTNLARGQKSLQKKENVLFDATAVNIIYYFLMQENIKTWNFPIVYLMP